MIIVSPSFTFFYLICLSFLLAASAEPSDNVKHEETGVFKSTKTASAFEFTCCKHIETNGTNTKICSTFCYPKGDQRVKAKHCCLPLQKFCCEEKDRSKPKFTTITDGEMDAAYIQKYIVVPFVVIAIVGIVLGLFLFIFQCCRCGGLNVRNKTEDDKCSVRICIFCCSIPLCCSSKQFRRASFFVGIASFLAALILVCIGFGSISKISTGFEEFASGADSLTTWSKAMKSTSSNLETDTNNLYTELNKLDKCLNKTDNSVTQATAQAKLLSDSAKAAASTMGKIDTSSFSGNLKDAVKRISDAITTAVTTGLILIMVIVLICMFYVYGGSEYAFSSLQGCVHKGFFRCFSGFLPITMMLLIWIVWLLAAATNMWLSPYADFCMAPEAMMLTGFGNSPGPESKPDASLYFYSFCDEAGYNLDSPYLDDNELQEFYSKDISKKITAYASKIDDGGKTCWTEFKKVYPVESHTMSSNGNFDPKLSIKEFYDTTTGCMYVSSIIDKFLGGEGLCGNLFDGLQSFRDVFLGIGIELVIGEYFRSVLMTDMKEESYEGEEYEMSEMSY